MATGRLAAAAAGARFDGGRRDRGRRDCRADDEDAPSGMCRRRGGWSRPPASIAGAAVAVGATGLAVTVTSWLLSAVASMGMLGVVGVGLGTLRWEGGQGAATAAVREASRRGQCRR